MYEREQSAMNKREQSAMNKREQSAVYKREQPAMYKENCLQCICTKRTACNVLLKIR